MAPAVSVDLIRAGEWLDFNRGPAPHCSDERVSTQQRFVPTAAARQAVEGREGEIVRLLGISWHGRDHITCPYPGHPDKNPSWRLMEDGKAVCSCREPHSVFDVAMHLDGLDFEAAKIRVMGAIGREDLIVDPTAKKPKAKGLTLGQYAEAKRLPVEWLRKIGVQQSSYGQIPAAVRTPYYRLDGGLRCPL